MTEETPARIRSQRLSAGRCPDHGTMLSKNGMFVPDGMDQTVHHTYKCPEKECVFEVVARTGSGMHKLLR